MIRTFWLFLLALTLWSTVSAMPLQHMATRVAGGTRMDVVDGPPSVSAMVAPKAICRGRTDDELLIGTSTYFRTYSRSTMMLGTLFGQPSSGSADGAFSVATVEGPRGCVTVSIGNLRVTYFVERSNSLRYIKGNEVFSVKLGSNPALSDLTVYQGKLYVIADSTRDLWTCLLDSAGKPSCVTTISLSNCTHNQFKSIVVDSRGIFTIGGENNLRGLCWFSLTGNSITSLPGYFDDISGLNSGELYTSEKREIRYITVQEGATNSLSTHRLTGNSSRSCPPITEGYDPTICQVESLLALSEKEIYFASKNMLISITLPPQVLPKDMERPPLPVGYPDESTALTIILRVMERSLNDELGTVETKVDRKSLNVDDNTWKTHFNVEVQQKEFDEKTTADRVEKFKFTEAMLYVWEYYNKTDEVVYTDRNIIPFCNETKLRLIERALAEKAREVLLFPLIYTDFPKNIEIKGNPNITVIKLLMPATFGGTDHVNGTTHPLLVNANLSALMFDIVSSQYDPQYLYTVVFPGDKYDFSHLTEEEEQEARWIVHDLISGRLQVCDELSSGGGGGGGGSQDTTECEILINNRTALPPAAPNVSPDSQYKVILPENSDYDFNTHTCLDDTDWSPLERWVDKKKSIVIKDKKSKCNRACIIAIAVVTALLLTALIVVLVVLTSKRKRLATVVAPQQPKFKSSLDDEEEMVTSNPLD